MSEEGKAPEENNNNGSDPPVPDAVVQDSSSNEAAADTAAGGGSADAAGDADGGAGGPAEAAAGGGQQPSVADASRSAEEASNSPEGLSPYFATLLTNSDAASSSGAAAAAAGGGGGVGRIFGMGSGGGVLLNNNSTNNAASSTVQSRAQMVALLWNGVESIVAAGKSSNYYSGGGAGMFGGEFTGRLQAEAAAGYNEPANQQHHQQQIANNQNENDNNQQPTTPPALHPRDAALYLCAVAKHQVALEEAVLRAGWSPNGSSAAGGGGSHSAGGGGGAAEILAGGPVGNTPAGAMIVKQVADIAMAAGIAATFCQTRNEITQSGILPALRHLIDQFGTIVAPSTLGSSTASATKKHKSHRDGDASSSSTPSGKVFYTLTPFHPEFLQLCLLSSHYRHAQSFLLSHPISQHTLSPSYFAIDTTMYLRYHYYSGMVHMGCNDWNSALNSFQLCLAIPCKSVSAISVAARKKSLLCQCLVLEGEELDGSGVGGGNNGGAGVGSKKKKESLEAKVFELPGMVSQVVRNCMATPANRVGGGSGGESGGGGDAPESTSAGGAETSEHARGGSHSRSGIRRNRSAASSSSEIVDDTTPHSGRSAKTKKHQHLGRYHDLVSTYITGNASHYATLLAEMNDVLHSDGNWGLAKRLEGRLAYRAVRQVASVYSVVGVDAVEDKLQGLCASLGSLGNEMRGCAVEDALMGMSSCDWEDPLVANPFSAKIDQFTGMVTFQSDDDCSDGSNEDLDDMDEQWLEYDLTKRLDSCISLAERVRDLDINLTTSTKYQQHVSKEMLMKGETPLRQGQGVTDIGLI